ncbi:hypothetical protein HK102_002451 [Quaeritorhiza haematococci]|nr:hypothetical protein HK102_002451 [Quaeritorhiza haematococci]
MGQLFSTTTHPIDLLYEKISGDFPSKEGSTFQLPDGRLLAYKEYTDTALSDAEIGSLPAILLLPGFPGSRFFTHPQVARTGHIKGFRFIVLERPGVGLSSPRLTDATPSQHTLLAFARDVKAFVTTHPRIRTPVHLFAYSGGTPFALACAHVCGPSLIKSLSLVAAIGPPEAPTKGLSVGNQIGFIIARKWPWLLRKMITHEESAILKSPTQSIKQEAGFMSGNCKNDRRLWSDPDVVVHFLKSILETRRRRQGITDFEEIRMWTKDWGFALEEVQVKTRIWQGEEDHACTPAMGRFIAEKMGEDCAECRIVREFGHMLYFEVWDQVMDWISGEEQLTLSAT